MSRFLDGKGEISWEISVARASWPQVHVSRCELLTTGHSVVMCRAVTLMHRYIQLGVVSSLS